MDNETRPVGIAVESVTIGDTRSTPDELIREIRRARRVFILTANFGYARIMKPEAIELVEEWKGVLKYRKDWDGFVRFKVEDDGPSGRILWIY
jgi:hypothetical protein